MTCKYEDSCYVYRLNMCKDKDKCDRKVLYEWEEKREERRKELVEIMRLNNRLVDKVTE